MCLNIFHADFADFFDSISIQFANINFAPLRLCEIKNKLKSVLNLFSK